MKIISAIVLRYIFHERPSLIPRIVFDIKLRDANIDQ